MLKFTLKTDDFKNIMKFCQKAIDVKNVRPFLHYIQLKLENERCTANATDSFKIHSITVPCEDDCKGELLVPFIKSIPKSTYTTVTELKYEIKFEFISKSEVGTVIVEKPTCDYPDIKPFLPKEKPEFTICFDPKFLKEVTESINYIARKEKAKLVEIDFYGEYRQAIFKVAGNFAMLLPVRRR